MDTTTTTDPVSALIEFRAGFYQAWTRWRDAGFELCEAMLCTTGPVASVPMLSLDPVFRRSHGSLYKCLDRGRIDAEQMRDLLVAHRPRDWPLVFAVDESVWPRCSAQTSPERAYYYHPSKHSAGQPVVAGWSYQWIATLGWARDSWTAPVDAVRIPPGADPLAVTADQLRDLTRRLNHTTSQTQVPVFVFDAGYDAIALTHELADLNACLVIRIREDRVFYTDPPEPTGTAGRPRRHGERRGCAEPDTWPTPDQHLHGHDERYGTISVTAWHRLHPRLYRRGRWAAYDQAPIVTGTIVRVDVEHPPKPLGRNPKPLWLWIAGPHPDIDLCWRAYLHRFDLEHTFRFVKTTLGWTTPRLCTPEQADRWTWLTIAAYTQLRLARNLIQDHPLPWERHTRPDKLSPARIRREFRCTTPLLGTPARPPKSRSPGPGRPTGTTTGPRPRHPAIKRSRRTPTKG